MFWLLSSRERMLCVLRTTGIPTVQTRMLESSDAAEINAEKGLQQRIGYEVLNGVVSETADAFTRYATAMGKQDLSFMDRFVSFISPW